MRSIVSGVCGMASRDKQQYEKVANTLDKGIVPQKGNQWGK